MHLSAFVGVPLFVFIGTMLNMNNEKIHLYAPVGWLVFSFTITLFIVLFLLRKEFGQTRSDKASIGSSILWTIGGIFLALFAQTVAANIEYMLGIDAGSENTQQILRVIESVPIFILVSSVIGPILEEIVFRKIIFGSLYKRFNFVISALISSLIFALAHQEPEHIILYSAIGLTFAYLYVKTKRIIVPILTHVAMNTMVVLIQSVYREEIEKILKEMEQIQTFIGGFF